MKKIINTIIFLSIMFFFNPNALAETKKDCSQYSTKTLTGLMDRMKCNRGEPVAERKKPKKFSDLNHLKPKKTPITRWFYQFANHPSSCHYLSSLSLR